MTTINPSTNTTNNKTLPNRDKQPKKAHQTEECQAVSTTVNSDTTPTDSDPEYTKFPDLNINKRQHKPKNTSISPPIKQCEPSNITQDSPERKQSTNNTNKNNYVLAQMSKYQRNGGSGINFLNLSTKLVNQAGLSIHSNTFMSSSVIKAKTSSGMAGLGRTNGCEGIEGSVVMNSSKSGNQILCRGK